MIVYIATRFDWWHQAAIARSLLISDGHTVTSRWIDVASGLNGQDALPIGDPRRAEHAEEDLEDLEAADAIFVLVPPDGGCGMWLELGVAIGRMRRGEMRVVLAGPDVLARTIFAELRGIEVFGSLSDAVAALGSPVKERCPTRGARLRCGLPVGHDGPCEVRR